MAIINETRKIIALELKLNSILENKEIKNAPIKTSEIGEISKTRLKEKVLINFKFNIATL